MRELFDDIIKKKLENFKNRPDGIAWEDLKARMDSEFGPEIGEHIDEQLDQNVKSKIDDYTVAYKSSHWAVLKSKLKRQARNLENLYVSKTFEFITFVLLLMTFFQSGFYLPLKKNFHSNDVAFIQSPNNTKKAEANNLLAHLNELQNDLSVDAEIKNVSSEIQLQSSNSLNSEAPLVFGTANAAIRPETKMTSEKAIAENFTRATTEFVESNSTLITLGHLDAISSLNLYAFDIHKNIPFVQQGIAHKKNTQETSDRYLSMFINADNNLINTPADQVYQNIDAVLFNSFGYGAGISYDMAFNDIVEFGAGLSYATLSYQPQQINEVFLDQETGGTYSIFLENIFFSVINVPLNLRLKFGDQSAWSFYTEIGLSANMIAEADYKTISTALRIPVAGVPPAEFDAHASNNENGPRLFQKSFTDGVFQGGNLNDNLYFTANIGLGLRKAISNHTALFGSLKYRNHVLDKGVGPNQDKLHAVSFTLGAQYSLN